MVSQLLIFVISQVCVHAADVEVRTSAGLIRGVSSHGVSSFLGVPFAQPPIGALRFVSPVPHQNWSGVRNATEAPSACVQGDLKGSEDCLYLNAFAPAKRPEKLNPVIVNIHGGGFVGGAASTSTKLTKKTGVVVFAIQYRLGVLGFLSPQSPPPNFGIQDQQFALRWVQQNAEAFGGDATRVMIYGCSAGGASVAGHLVLPGSAGLYSSASIASPGGHQGWMTDEKRGDDDWMSPSLNEKHSRQVLRGVSCTRSTASDSLACLQNASLATVFSFQKTLRFAPALPEEGQYPLGMIHHGKWNQVPTMIGGASCEGCLSAVQKLGPLPLVSKKKFDDALIQYGLAGAEGGVGPDMLEQWYKERIETEGRWRTFARIAGDSGHSCSTALHAEALASHASNMSGVWRYLFDISLIPGLPGATHCAEIEYLDDEPVAKTSAEHSLEAFVSQAMVNLAAHGDPNVGSSSSTFWSKFSNDNQSTLLMTKKGAEMGSTVDTVRAECNNWKPYLGFDGEITKDDAPIVLV